MADEWTIMLLSVATPAALCWFMPVHKSDLLCDILVYEHLLRCGGTYGFPNGYNKINKWSLIS